MPSLADRMREAGMPAEELSQRTGLSPQRVADLLHDAEPSLRELRLVASALQLSLSDFLPPTSAEKHAEVLFRKRASEKRRPAAPVDHFTRRVGGALELLVDGPKSTPHWLSDFKMPSASYIDAENAASLFRAHFFRGDNLSPLLLLPSILVHELGALVYVGSRQSFDGASVILNGQVFIFVAAQFRPRMLFTLAHELGHILTHHNDHEVVVLDLPEDIGELPRRSARQEEAFANAFASCLLLPREGVAVALRKIREMIGVHGDAVGDVELLYLAGIFGVSFQVAARRCEDLALLPTGGAKSLYDHLVKEHESPEKRAKSLGLPERPEIEFPPLPPRLLDTAMKKVRSGEISVGRASQILNLSIPDIFLLNARS